MPEPHTIKCTSNGGLVSSYQPEAHSSHHDTNPLWLPTMGSSRPRKEHVHVPSRIQHKRQPVGQGYCQSWRPSPCRTTCHKPRPQLQSSQRSGSEETGVTGRAWTPLVYSCETVTYPGPPPPEPLALYQGWGHGQRPMPGFPDISKPRRYYCCISFSFTQCWG